MYKRKTIGVVIDTMDGIFQKELVKMIRSSADERDFNIIFVSGQALRYKENTDSQYNTVFNLLASTHIDGVIFVLNSLDIYYNNHGVEDLKEKYAGKPIISLAIPIEAAHAICLDNKQASKDIVEHMVGLHGYRKLAYISGPMGNNEARDRYDGFLEVLKKYGVKQHLFYEGDCLQGTGIQAVDQFLKDQDNMPKAIICANDIMAAGVFLRLSEKGIKVPEDVAICGFDNLEISTAFYPSFTTVTQPIDKICDIAMSQFEKIFSGIEVGPITYVTSEIVVRESCGCFNMVVSELDTRTQYDENIKTNRMYAADAFEEEFMKNKEFVIPVLMSQLTLSKSIKGDFYQRITRLLDMLMEDVHSLSNTNHFNDGYYSLISYEINEKK
ncbi:MAG: LacI family DNA-binding transcriptional regulator [Vallitaleaceae bacterium]|jgi:DNA-binding LacI/PurR family transcriptional regulator|nr:LacI family DNA-binding transcriptional regulator [Vallitaleaceae bacterium]